MKKSIVLLLLVLSMSFVKAQDSTSVNKHSILFKPQFFQIKDKFNYGLVFNGFNLVLGYGLERDMDKHLLTYSADLAFGANFNKGVGLAWHFKPLDLYYGFKSKKITSFPLTIGPYMAINYQWQLYPELQSGHMFWFTSMEVGPRLIVKTPFKGRAYKITFTNSVAGWAARPSPATETYFYSLSFSDFINNAHKNLKFGSFNLFNHTHIEIETKGIVGKDLFMAYEFEYFGYYQNPQLSYIVHSLNFRWALGNKRQELK